MKVLSQARYAVALLAVYALATPSSSFAQHVPQKLNISGALYQANGTAVTQASVDFKIEILNSGTPKCVLYSEEHLGENLSATKGGFSLEVGTGTSPQNYFKGTAVFSAGIFENSGVASAPFAGCATGVTMAAGEDRLIRVSYNLGSGLVAMTPDVPITSAAYAMVAENLQGKTPTDFIQVKDDVGTDLTQSNVENIFSATNYDKLSRFLAGTENAPYSLNNQRITNVATPTAGTDAVNRNYADGYVGGKTAVTTGVGVGVGNGYTLIWDAGLGQWTTGTPSAIDSSKLPLAGGTMAGNITMAGYDLYNTGHITMGNQKLLQLGTYTAAQEAALTLAAADKGKILYNTTTDTVRMWNGSAFSGFAPSGAAGGDLTGTYPNPLIANNAVTTAKIANLAVTDAKIADLDPAKLQARGALANQVLTWNGSAWLPASNPGDIWSVYAGTGLTGGGTQYDVTLALADTAVTPGAYGAAGTVGTFTVDQQGRLTAASNVAISIASSQIQQSGAGTGDVMKWNGSAWLPATDAGILNLVAGNGALVSGSAQTKTIDDSLQHHHAEVRSV